MGQGKYERIHACHLGQFGVECSSSHAIHRTIYILTTIEQTAQ